MKDKQNRWEVHIIEGDVDQPLSMRDETIVIPEGQKTPSFLRNRGVFIGMDAQLTVKMTAVGRSDVLDVRVNDSIGMQGNISGRSGRNLPMFLELRNLLNESRFIPVENDEIKVRVEGKNASVIFCQNHDENHICHMFMRWFREE